MLSIVAHALQTMIISILGLSIPIKMYKEIRSMVSEGVATIKDIAHYILAIITTLLVIAWLQRGYIVDIYGLTSYLAGKTACFIGICNDVPKESPSLAPIPPPDLPFPEIGKPNRDKCFHFNGRDWCR